MAILIFFQVFVSACMDWQTHYTTLKMGEGRGGGGDGGVLSK